VKLKKKVGVQAVDDIGSSTFMGCGFTLVEGPASEQRVRTPFAPVSGSSSAQPSVKSVLSDQAKLKSELTEVKDALAEEKMLNAKAMKISLRFSLLSPLSSPLLLPETPLHPISVACSLKHSALSLSGLKQRFNLFSTNYFHYLIVHF